MVPDWPSDIRTRPCRFSESLERVISLADKLRALCYINQFYAGIGGEDKADIGISLFEGKGPSIGMQAMWRQEMEVVATIACGDNFANTEASLPELAAALAEAVGKFKPHVFISGPAFNAGRYGVACARTADYVRSELGIPSVTAMYPENPAVPMFVKHNYIVATPETAAGMTKPSRPLQRWRSNSHRANHRRRPGRRLHSHRASPQ